VTSSPEEPRPGSETDAFTATGIDALAWDGGWDTVSVGRDSHTGWVVRGNIDASDIAAERDEQRDTGRDHHGVGSTRSYGWLDGPLGMSHRRDVSHGDGEKKA